MPEPRLIPDLERDLHGAAARMATKRSLPRLTTRRFTALTATAGAAAAALVAFLAGAGSDPQATATPIRSDGVVLGDSFGAFRVPPPADLTGNPFAERRGLVTVDPASARRLTVPGPDVWIAADDRQVCIGVASITEARSFAGACARPAQIIDGGLFTMSRPAPADVTASGLPEGTTQIAGLLPDGVKSVTFTLADGSQRQAAVTGNGVTITVRSLPAKVSFRDASNVLHRRPL